MASSAIPLLSSISWPRIKAEAEQVVFAVADLARGDYCELGIRSLAKLGTRKGRPAAL